MKIKVTLTEDMLGTASANPELHKEYIASRSKDAAKVEEEMAALSAEKLIEKALTVFPKLENGIPFLYDYQFKGFLKEAIGALVEVRAEDKNTVVKVGKTKLSKFTCKRLVDNTIFVFPRKIPLAPVSEICTRPLRAETMQGPRVSLASSEAVPAGTSFELEIRLLAPSLEPLVKEALDYGALKGLGQWRNSGKGRLTWELVPV